MPRNVPDNILQQLPKNGGVVMVTFVPGFPSNEVAAYEAARRSSRRSCARSFRDDAEAVTAELKKWRDVAIPSRARRSSQIADHIDHIKKVAGIDHIGLGGDFDGITVGAASAWKTSRSIRR